MILLKKCCQFGAFVVPASAFRCALEDDSDASFSDLSHLIPLEHMVRLEECYEIMKQIWDKKKKKKKKNNNNNNRSPVSVIPVQNDDHALGWNLRISRCLFGEPIPKDDYKDHEHKDHKDHKDPRRLKKRKRLKKKNSAAAAAVSGPESSDCWDGFSRRISGPLSLSKDLHKFKSVFKISRNTFNYICSLMKDDLLAKTSKSFSFNNRRTLTVDDQVAIALSRLSSGESLQNVGLSFGLNHSTVSQVTWRFVEAMEQRGLDHLKWPNSQELEIIKSKFEKIQGLPNCCGAIDATHVVMCLPSAESNSKVWLDSEENYSMVLQAVVDPEMRFRDIITGWPGSLKESTVLKRSGFCKLCEKGLRLNGKTMELVEGSGLRENIVGDPGYPLLPWLITPYQGNDIS